MKFEFMKLITSSEMIQPLPSEPSASEVVHMALHKLETAFCSGELNLISIKLQVVKYSKDNH